jgi:pyruvate carboxylase subunit B
LRYYVTLGEKTIEVDLSADSATIDGVSYRTEMVQVAGTPMRHLLLNGRSYPLVAREGAARGTWDLQLEGCRYELDVVDERTRAIRAMTARNAGVQGPKPLRAPMPGLILRVEVQAAETVSPGQGLVIMEAMKMENELKAAGAGVVARINVQAGEAVEKGTVLIEFETVAG